jgi:hypothetical protein
MALTQNTIMANGIAVNGAYIRAQHVSISDKTKGLVTVGYYVDSNVNAAFQSQSFEFDYNIDGANPIEQAYNHIKTLPAFADTRSC